MIYDLRFTIYDLIFCLLILILTACSSLPKLIPPDPEHLTEYQKQCSQPFLIGKWQFTHSIKASMPGGKQGILIGVTVISSHDKIISCAIMTIEGLVLFSAEYDQKINIQRAIQPFDSPDFANGLMDDIRLIFFTPDGDITNYGWLQNNKFVCRYNLYKNGFVDVITNPLNREWQINKYEGTSLSRIVEAFYSKSDSARLTACSIHCVPVPCEIRLTAQGKQSYSINMELIEVIQLITDH